MAIAYVCVFTHDARPVNLKLCLNLTSNFAAFAHTMYFCQDLAIWLYTELGGHL